MSELTEQSVVPEPDSPKPLKILAVEDEERVSFLMRAFFTSLKQPFEVVTNAKDALDKLQEAHDTDSPYDVLITDRGLEDPNQDGFYLVSEMSKRGIGAGIYTVMLSGSAEEIRERYTEKELEEIGIHDLIGKIQFTRKSNAAELLLQARNWQEKQKEN